MYAQLGSTIFNGIFSPHAHVNENETIYGEVDLIGGKPDLQLTGQALDVIRLEIRLHQDFCNPELRYNELEAYRINGEILPYIDGYGNMLGNFVITKMERTVLDADTLGKVMLCECVLTLKQYVDPNRALTKLSNAKRRAFALGATSLTIKNISPISFPQANLFASIKAISGSASAANEAIANAQKKPGNILLYLGHARDSVAKVLDGAQSLQTKAEAYASRGISVGTDLTSSYTAVKTTGQALSESIKSRNVPVASADMSQLNRAVSALNKAALPIQKLLILR